MGKEKDGSSAWKTFWSRVKNGWRKVKEAMRPVGNAIKVIASYAVRMRKILLSVPVLIIALVEAERNWQSLPERVGITLVNPGEFAQMVSKGAAVFGPLAVTGACLLLMYCSRRTLYPWLISVFSLTLPLLLYLTNVMLV